MPAVTANVTAEEKENLILLAFIKSKSAREVAGDAIRVYLKRHKHPIAGAKRMRKLLPDQK